MSAEVPGYYDEQGSTLDYDAETGTFSAFYKGGACYDVAVPQPMQIVLTDMMLEHDRLKQENQRFKKALADIAHPLRSQTIGVSGNYSANANDMSRVAIKALRGEE